ncbi:hypothetical protein J31TS3_61400 [Paenibacillus lactis]|nr:hypothetical protein J31TS3_61400 [Paenibacillus lactis]
MELTNTNRSRAYPKSFLKESSLRKHKDFSVRRKDVSYLVFKVQKILKRF